MKVRSFTNRESEFPNRRKITILEQNANEIIADITLQDKPHSGKEGTKIDAELLTDFQSEILRASENSDKAVADSSSALVNSEQSIAIAVEAKEGAITAITNSQNAISISQEAKTTALRVESALADRGATINVDGVSQSVVSFTSDPQTQLDQKLINTFESIKESVLSVAYPVGSIYMSINSANPSTLFGGVWEAIEDRFLLAAGSNYLAGSTGGVASHTLTIDEMPVHKHENEVFVTKKEQDAHNHQLRSGNGKVANACGLGYAYCYAVGGADNDTSGRWYQNSTPKDGEEIINTVKPALHVEVDITNVNAGLGQAHENMPPYLTVYMWKRIS